MKIELTNQECYRLAELAAGAKIAAALANIEAPNPGVELRRNNMAELERKLSEALLREFGQEGRA